MVKEFAITLGHRPLLKMGWCKIERRRVVDGNLPYTAHEEAARALARGWDAERVERAIEDWVGDSDFSCCIAEVAVGEYSELQAPLYSDPPSALPQRSEVTPRNGIGRQRDRSRRQF